MMVLKRKEPSISEGATKRSAKIRSWRSLVAPQLAAGLTRIFRHKLLVIVGGCVNGGPFRRPLSVECVGYSVCAGICDSNSRDVPPIVLVVRTATEILQVFTA